MQCANLLLLGQHQICFQDHVKVLANPKPKREFKSKQITHKITSHIYPLRDSISFKS